MLWRDSPEAMAKGNTGKRKLQHRGSPWSDNEDPPSTRMRVSNERRSKAREDVREVPDRRGKGPARQSSPTPKKKKMIVEVSEEEEDEERESPTDEDNDHSGGLKEQSWR